LQFRLKSFGLTHKLNVHRSRKIPGIPRFPFDAFICEGGFRFESDVSVFQNVLIFYRMKNYSLILFFSVLFVHFPVRLFISSTFLRNLVIGCSQLHVVQGNSNGHQHFGY